MRSKVWICFKQGVCVHQVIKLMMLGCDGNLTACTLMWILKFQIFCGVRIWKYISNGHILEFYLKSNQRKTLSRFSYTYLTVLFPYHIQNRRDVFCLEYLEKLLAIMIWQLKFNTFMSGNENLRKPGQLLSRWDKIYATVAWVKSDFTEVVCCGFAS